MAFVHVLARWCETSGEVPDTSVICSFPIRLEVGVVLNAHRPGAERGAIAASQAAGLTTTRVFSQTPAEIVAASSGALVLTAGRTEGHDPLPPYMTKVFTALRTLARPWLALSPHGTGVSRHHVVLRTAVWLSVLRPAQLYVTGGHERAEPGIQAWTTDFLTDVWAVLKQTPYHDQAVFTPTLGRKPA